MKELKVRLKTNPYSILVGNNILPLLGKQSRKLGLKGKAMVLTNPAISRIYLKKVVAVLETEKYSVSYCDTLPDSEAAKSEKSLFRIYSQMIRAGLDRSSFVVALGGGIVGDVSGYAASTYMRGIPWIGVPTTLLAQVDSSIGGKTAINLPEGKNLIGTFHQPKLVLSDMNFLRTLPQEELRNAMAEVIKYAVIWDAGFFNYLEQHQQRALKKDLNILTSIVARCAEIKKTVVEGDEREEKGLRAILNYGHTFGHAFEAASGGWTNSLPHGQGVALGMLAAAELACGKGFFAKKDQIRQFRLIKEAGLPVSLSKKISLSKILFSMQNDKKKKDGKLKFILPVRLGKVEVRGDVSLGEVKNVVRGLIHE